MQKYYTISLKHTFRETYGCAYVLVKMNVINLNPLVMLQEPPSSMYPYELANNLSSLI
jgi:hypothetical protein